MISFKRHLNELKITLDYHNELNPVIWDGTTLKPEVRTKLLQFASTWTKFAKIPEHLVQDVIFTGGMTNYNYTKLSDIDVHVVADRSKIGVSPDFIDDYLQDKKLLWTLTHDIKIYGYPLEPYCQDVHEKFPPGQGVYSLMHNKWLQIPNNEHLDFKNDKLLKSKVSHYMKVIDHMIKGKVDLDTFKDLKKKFTEMRSSGIQRAGEFSFENLVYKDLRNRGYFDKMNKYEKTMKDQDLSL
jgi:hypothetical protein